MKQPQATNCELVSKVSGIPLRVAIVQAEMYWDGPTNTQSIVRHIELAAQQGARLCLFPELAVTGFHRQIAREAVPARVQAALEQVQRACARHRLAAALGAPTFGDGGSIFNSHLLIDDSGHCLAAVEKRGLTAPEATFFAAGRQRPVVTLLGKRCTAVICREIEDGDEVCAQLQGLAPELVFWPGLMGPEEGAPVVDPPRHVQQAQALAQRLGAWVLQSNWPMNLNYPELSAKTGRSVVIAPDGQICLALPLAQAGLGVFDLGSTQLHWMPAQAAEAHGRA